MIRPTIQYEWQKLSSECLQRAGLLQQRCDKVHPTISKSTQNFHLVTKESKNLGTSILTEILFLLLFVISSLKQRTPRYTSETTKTPRTAN